MNKVKIILLLACTQSIISCATNTNRQCISSDTNDYTIYKKSIEKVNTIDNVVTEKKIPLKKISGIQSVEINDATLKLNFVDLDYIELYSAPQLKITEKIFHDAHPIGGMIGGVVFLGFLYQKEDMIDFIYGCYEEKYLNKEEDFEKRVLIDNKWQDAKINHKILISGFNRDFEFTTTNKNEIDLKNAILSSTIEPNTILKITCLDCNIENKNDKSTINNLNISNSLTITHDFRSLKPKLVKDEEQRLLELKRITEKKAEQEQERLKAERLKKGGVSLDEYKIKCQKLGFKTGSKEFGDCVLELNEIK